MQAPYGASLKRIFFIGIGGIGMSALARYFKSLGAAVSGYDKTPTPLTDALQSEGIQVHFEDIPSLADPEAGLVVYTPAIPQDHAQLNWYRSHGYEVIKRSDVLQRITGQSHNICIGGTHGKTTITTMTAHLFRDSGMGCNAFLGGIAANYNTNFWSSANDLCVIEADEYDRSFLKLLPDIAVITAMDADHLDIYGTEAEVVEAYRRFASGIKPGGTLIHHIGLDCRTYFSGNDALTYSLDNEAADVYVSSLSVTSGSYSYTVTGKDFRIENLKLHMGGLHNVENTLPAIMAARLMGMEEASIRQGIASFKGVKRRFEYHIRTEEKVFIDDYAHHPEELKALISGVRSLYGQAPVTIVFQPHLFSRTRDLCDGFAEALSMADKVILLPIYPARELPIPEVNSRMIAERMDSSKVQLLEKENLLDYLKIRRPRILVTAGAGDIDALLPSVKETLENNS